MSEQSISCRRTEYVTLSQVEPVAGYVLEQVRTLLNRGLAEFHRGQETHTVRLKDGTKIATFKRLARTGRHVAKYDDFQVGV